MMRHRLILIAAVSFGLIGCTVRPGAFVPLPPTASGVADGVAPKVDGEASKPVSEYGTLTLTIRWPERPEGYQTALIPTSTNALTIKVSSGSTVVAETTVTREANATTATANLSIKAANNLSVQVLAYRDAGPVPVGAQAIAQGAATVNITRSKKTTATISLTPLIVPTITGLSRNAGVTGDEVTITGTNFGSGSIPVFVYFNGYLTVGATRSSETSLAVQVPPGAPTGQVVVKADGVSSVSNVVFWVPQAVTLSTIKDFWDHASATSQIVLFGKTKQLTATTTWEAKSGETAEQYGTPPNPTWSSSDTTAGTVDNSGLFTAGNAYVAAGTDLRASHGSMSSSALTMIPETVSFSLELPPAPRVLGGKGRPSLIYSGVNTFSDGATNSYVTYSAASASIDWYTGRAIATDFGSNGTIVVSAESQIDPSQKTTTDITLSNYTVTTLAGDGYTGRTDGTGTSAQFSGARGITQIASGDFYIGDGNYVRKMTKAGEVSTVASDGSNFGIAVASDGVIYTADPTFHVIRKIQNGVPSLFAGSPDFAQGGTDAVGTSARFNGPYAVALDATRNLLYVCDNFNNRIRKIDLITQAVSTLAGSTAGYTDATGTAAKFNSPHGLAVDSQGNVIVADMYNHVIRKVTATGVVTTLASGFTYPAGVAVDAQDNVYVAEYLGHRVRKIATSGEILTLAGTGTEGFTDGIGTLATLKYPISLVVDPSGDLYVLENGNYAVRVLR